MEADVIPGENQRVRSQLGKDLSWKQWIKSISQNTEMKQEETIVIHCK